MTQKPYKLLTTSKESKKVQIKNETDTHFFFCIIKTLIIRILCHKDWQSNRFTTLLRNRGVYMQYHKHHISQDLNLIDSLSFFFLQSQTQLCGCDFETVKSIQQVVRIYWKVLLSVVFVRNFVFTIVRVLKGRGVLNEGLSIFFFFWLPSLPGFFKVQVMTHVQWVTT